MIEVRGVKNMPNVVFALATVAQVVPTVYGAALLGSPGSLLERANFQHGNHYTDIGEQRQILTSGNPVAKRADYRNPPQLPPLFNGSVTSVVADGTGICNRTEALLNKIVAEVSPENATFANVIQPMIDDDQADALFSNILDFYQYVSANEALRDASTVGTEIMTECGIEISMREDIFKLVDSVFSKRDTSEKDLDPESRRLLEKTRQGYIWSGLGLPAGPQRDKYKELSNRISSLEIDYNRNMNEENGGIWLTSVELAGIPSDVLDSLEKGTGENAGKVRLTFKYPDMDPAMRYVLNPDIRKRIFLANDNRVGWLNTKTS
jgi:metallopeptidase MepB